MVRNFFGLRDFIYFLKAIHSQAVVGKDAVMITNTDLIIRSCERNFGGLGIEKLHEIIKAFMISLSDAEAIELRVTIEVLRDNLEPKNDHTSISPRPR